MLPAGTFTICILLLFGAQAREGKNENVTNFDGFVQVLDHDQTSGTDRDQPPAEMEVSQEVKNLDQHRTDGKGNEEMELEERLQTNTAKEYKIKEELENNEIQDKELENEPMINMKLNSVPTELKDQLLTRMGKDQKIEVSNQPSVEMQDKRKFDEYGKKELQNPIKIHVHDCETDFVEGLPSMWTKLQTRATSSNQGPILGFRKGSKRFPRMRSCLSKTSSYLGKKLSPRKSKKFSSGLDKQASSLEKQSIASAEPISSDPPKSPPKATPPGGVWLRKPQPYVPPRKEFEPFCIADNIKEIVMIPGSGEFVYDTIIQKKTATVRNPDGEMTPAGPAKPINANNDEKMSDAMLSLQQLKEDLPNVEWVSVVVNWFANSIDIEECEIYPAVEFWDGFVKPYDWVVGWTTRPKARLISRDSVGNPKYGGTVSDGALIRYIEELHRRGYKVMLYPMLVLDTEIKEWRGRITGPYYEINRFFTYKYNPFIEHYINIAKQTGVEAFIIGSEFVGLTKIQDKQGSYPAVSQLVELAKQVKTDLGRDVTVTYAADWTEYHIASNERYPLDKLWASEYIDVVGINAYFPLTDYKEPDGGYTVEDVILSWTTGEGYNYYYDYSKKTPEFKLYEGSSDSKWAWKNIEKWWSEHHFDGKGKATEWRPKSKKIWFTEFGFPSVDACTNEPYIFVDGRSSESKYPRYSAQTINLTSQKNAIEGTLKKWRNSEVVERMFLYAWDARPFPYFPRKLDVWGDGVNWESGHWIQGKIGKIRGDKREPMRSVRSASFPQRSAPVIGSTSRRPSHLDTNP